MDATLPTQSAFADLIERLMGIAKRHRKAVKALAIDPATSTAQQMLKDADEIDNAAQTIRTLAAENERVREVLEQLLNDMNEATSHGMSWITYNEVQEFKRRASFALAGRATPGAPAKHWRRTVPVSDALSPADCIRCWREAGANPFVARMFLCPVCGNKRCPKASDHRNGCTGSNKPGQPGSEY